MKKWDGNYGKFTYISAKDDNLTIDENGTIYSNNKNGKKCIWCVASRLNQHLQRLWQVCGESTVINNDYRLRH